MKVQVMKDEMVALEVGEVDGDTYVVVACHDYDHLKTLPQVVSYNGIRCGRTGWNSDRNVAYYRSGVHIVTKA